jgi:hypothetical protein
METMNLEASSGPCPICHEAGGFHNGTVHSSHQVPVDLTWKSSELPPWDREKSVEPAHIKEDTAAVLGVLKTWSEEDL